MQNGSSYTKTILMVAGAIMAVMVLFPPKAIVSNNPLLNMSVSQSVGYSFIFSNPASDQQAVAGLLAGNEADKLVYAHIEWGKLLLQLVVVGGLAFGATKLLEKKS